eukprot:13090377-Ditylum_brightwellii.AAC.1
MKEVGDETEATPITSSPGTLSNQKCQFSHPHPQCLYNLNQNMVPSEAGAASPVLNQTTKEI